MTAQEPTPERRDRKHRDGRRGSCPPHRPIVVASSDEGHFVASCLACGFIAVVSTVDPLVQPLASRVDWIGESIRCGVTYPSIRRWVNTMAHRSRGPKREDGWEAKLAFDEAIQPPQG